MAGFSLKRVYDLPETGDGTRVLVDRLWPRGLTKEKAAVDLWAKDVAPSHELRRWFGHRPERWDDFRTRYGEELRTPEAREEVRALRAMARKGPVTLLYGAKGRGIEQRRGVARGATQARRYSMRIPRA